MKKTKTKQSVDKLPFKMDVKIQKPSKVLVPIQSYEQPVHLDAIRISISKMIDLNAISNVVGVDVYKATASSVIAELNAFLAGEKLPTRVISHPLNWIEAIKDRFFGKRLRAKWPVKYKNYEIDFVVLYPEFKAKLPEHKHIHQFRVFEDVSAGSPSTPKTSE